MDRFFPVPFRIRYFMLGGLLGIVLSLATFAGLIWLGAFPRESESEAFIMSADYRMSRKETELREYVRYLERELDLLRRGRSTSASYSTRSGS